MDVVPALVDFLYSACHKTIKFYEMKRYPKDTFIVLKSFLASTMYSFG